jgi:hypothetical protein
MDGIDPIPEGAGHGRAEEFKQLRTLVHASAISLLILAGTVFIFFYRQAVGVRKNTNEMIRYIVEYENSNASDMIAEVHRRYAEFARVHPDFEPIYRRYFGTNMPPPPRESPPGDAPKVAPVPVPSP